MKLPWRTIKRAVVRAVRAIVREIVTDDPSTAKTHPLPNKKPRKKR
jgi:hypothetical protein